MNVTGERVSNHETGIAGSTNLDEPSVKRQKTEEGSQVEAARPRSPSAKDLHRGKQEAASSAAVASSASSSASSSSSSASSRVVSSDMVRESSRRSGGQPPEFHQDEPVEVFFRFSHEKGQGYFPVETEIQGQLHPCIAKTDGWQPAVIESKFDPSQYDPRRKETYVKIKYVNPLWFNRLGQPYTDSRHRTDRVAPELVRRARRSNEVPYPKPKVSFFVTRWGGKKKVDPVTEGVGGWGQVGSNPSDNFINEVFREGELT